MTLKGMGLKADLPVIQLSDAFNEVFEGAAEAIQLPDNESIPSPDIGERFSEAFPLSFCAGGGIGEDLRTPCLKECITLEVKCLVSGGDAGVTDKHRSLTLEDCQLPLLLLFLSFEMQA
jgi:hypothetical protein